MNTTTITASISSDNGKSTTATFKITPIDNLVCSVAYEFFDPASGKTLEGTIERVHQFRISPWRLISWAVSHQVNKVKGSDPFATLVAYKKADMQ